MWKHSKDLFSMYLLFSQCMSFDNTQTQRTLSLKFLSYSCAYEKTKEQIPLRPNLHWETSKTTWRAFRVVGGGGGTPYNGPYGEAPPKRGTLFRLQVKSVRGSSLPYETFLSTHPASGSWVCRGLTNSPLMICSLSRGFLTRYRYGTFRVWFLVGLIIRFITLTLGTLRSEEGDGSESVA